MKPLGNNQLNSLGIFFQKKEYKNTFFPFNRVKQPFDLWEERSLHGKVNKNQKPILIKSKFLKQVSNNNVFVVNFFSTAFNEFRSQIQKLKIRGKINISNSFLNDLEPKKGWYSAEIQYEEYVNTIFQGLNTYIFKNSLNHKITNFNEFLKIFLSYINQIKNINFPITFSEFLISPFCTHSCGGLFLELSSQKYDVDSQKYDEWIQDSNFKFYTELAQKFGMKVDLNVPWRLIADIESPYMLKYIERDVGVNDIDAMFDVLYDVGYDHDPQKLKEVLLRFYNSYVISNPEYTLKDKCKSKTFRRQPISLEDIESMDLTLLKVYYFLKKSEKKISLSSAQDNINLQQAFDISKYYNLNQSFSFLNKNVFSTNGQQK